MKNSGKLIIATLAGAVTGAAFGVLFAPAKGSKTRNKIASGADDMARDVKKKVRNEAKSMMKAAKAIKGAADQKIDDLADAVIKKTESFKNHQ